MPNDGLPSQQLTVPQNHPVIGNRGRGGAHLGVRGQDKRQALLIYVIVP